MRRSRIRSPVCDDPRMRDPLANNGPTRVAETSSADLRERLAGVRGLILDLDGVLVLKARLLPGAVEALAALRLPSTVEREVEGAMRDFLRVSLERDARSLEFLDEVRRAVGPDPEIRRG